MQQYERHFIVVDHWGIDPEGTVGQEGRAGQARTIRYRSRDTLVEERFQEEWDEASPFYRKERPLAECNSLFWREDDDEV